MILLIFALSSLAFAAIIVNERMGSGVPGTWLGLQVFFFLGGLWLISGYEVIPGISSLVVSDLAGLLGFFILWETGNRKFTKPIFPGIKKSRAQTGFER